MSGVLPRRSPGYGQPEPLVIADGSRREDGGEFLPHVGSFDRRIVGFGNGGAGAVEQRVPCAESDQHRTDCGGVLQLATKT